MNFINTTISSSVSSLFGELSREEVDVGEVSFILDLIISSNHYLTNKNNFKNINLKKIKKEDIKIDNLINVKSIFIKKQFLKLRNMFDDAFFLDILESLFKGKVNSQDLNTFSIKGLELLNFFNNPMLLNLVSKTEKKDNNLIKEELESSFMYLRAMVYTRKESLKEILNNIVNPENFKNVFLFKAAVLKNVMFLNLPFKEDSIFNYYNAYKISEEKATELLLKYQPI